jgi:DNA-binding SARP family transcriptional activator
MLRIALLGTFQLRAGTTVVTTVNTPRLQALLAYLVLQRGAPQSRQQLAFLFWPDSTDAQARTNLRTLLHRLRTALPDADACLIVDAQSVCWRADATFTLDVVEFETALAHASSAEQAGAADTARAALEHAAAIYQGDLLPDCYDEWVRPERERLQRLALAALERLVEHLEHHRDYAAAIDYARRLLRLDPLRETTHLSLMRLHAAHGDRASALRVYHACATTLRHEIAAEPGPAIRTAYERLLAADAPQPVSAAALAASAPLVGRRAEWARMQATWQAAASGRPRLLVLAGEAGIGKTRLAEELQVWAGRQGAVTAITRCYAAEGDLAYAPVTEWLRTDAMRRRLARLDTIWLTEVVRLLPEVLTERPDLPRPGPLTERWQRRHMFEALARAVLAGNRPLLLLIDDLQWCDHDTLEWLHFLLRYEARARLLLVGTVRVEETGADLAALLDDVRRSDQLTEIALGPLSEAEAAALAGHMAGRPFSASATVDLYAETEGNPLFVVESVRAGLVREVQRQVPGADETIKLTRLPPGVQSVISHRLNQIAPAARELLRLAAVIGRSFTFSVLARAAEGDEDALVRDLDELWQRRIVREQGADAYDFSHDKLRLVAYDGLSAARRRLLHRRVAEALEAEHAANPDAVSGQIAAHYECAGQVERAVAYYRRAADVAQQVYANAEAIDELHRALALLTTTPSGEPRELQSTVAVLNERLGDLLHLSGQYAEARSAYQRALEYIAEVDRQASAHLHRKIGNSWRDQNRYDEAFAAYTAAEVALGMAPDETSHERWQTWMQIQFERVLTCYWLAHVPEMFRIIEAALPIAERYGSPLERARLFHYLGQANLRRDRYVASAETVAYARAYLAAIEEAGATAALPAARFQVGFALLWHNDLDAAEEQIRAALDLAERTGDISLEARCLTYLTIICRKRGQFDAVRAYAERSLRVAMAEQMPEYIGAAHGNLAWLAWRAANLADARAHGQRALAAWRGTSLVFSAQWTALWPLIGVALAENQVAEAAEYARALLDLQQQRPPEVLEVALEATVRAADVGDLEAARAEIARALDPARALGYL